MNQPNPPAQEAVLEFDHNVIEHLGIRLYQNKIVNVIAELVANCWDADSASFAVSFATGDETPFIAVSDDGIGMSYEEIRTRYLIIGKKKRSSPKEKSPAGRAPMGRKGIGKLAPFGIARKVDVLTIQSGLLNWFTLELSGLLTTAPGHHRYKPVFSKLNVPPADGWTATPGHPFAKLMNEFLQERAKTSGSGTLVLMTDLTTNRALTSPTIVAGLVDKFTVILARPDFVGFVNAAKIDAATAMPNFELRIPDPSQPYAIETVDGKEVKYWAGFVKAAEWPADQAGVGVYVHGKIGQDRPFFFGAKGKEIFQRYLYAVVEADWLDELESDLVSTDRTSINWSDPNATKLNEWGAKKVSAWLDAYIKHRSGMHLSEIKQVAAKRRAEKIIPVFSKAENDAIDQLVSDATKDLGKGVEAEGARNELLDAVSKAWVNLPSRNLIKSLWEQLSGKSDSSAFGVVVDKLQEHSVPEAMSLALTFAQRAYALSVLHDLIHKKSETNLQKLVEDFPWILQPRGDLLTADQHLKTTIEKAADALEEKDSSRPGRIVRGMSETERADFVFLTDPAKKMIAIVEIKKPSEELDDDHRRQLSDYIDFTRRFHSGAKVEGLLIGTLPAGGLENPDNRIKANSWDNIFLECRAAYIELLAAMLEHSDLDPSDARIKLVAEFGGDAVWQLLQKLGTKNEVLAALMQNQNSKVGGKVV